MKLRQADWPRVIVDLVDAFKEAAKSKGVHGRVAVHEERRGDTVDYVIVVRVPAGATVGARAMKPPTK